MIVISSLPWLVRNFTTYRFYEGKKDTLGMLTHFGEVCYPNTWPAGLRPLEERFLVKEDATATKGAALFFINSRWVIQ
jgi:hypothetical protein